MKKIILPIVFTLMTVGLFAQSAKVEAKMEQKKNQVEEKTTGPKIVFDKSVVDAKGNVVHDYGTIQQGSDGNCTFKFTNEGTEPLVLSKVRSSCGCTVPTWPRQPILPGQSSEIKVRYDTKRLGGIYKSIHIYSNASEKPLTARIKGKVIKKSVVVDKKDNAAPKAKK